MRSGRSVAVFAGVALLAASCAGGDDPADVETGADTTQLPAPDEPAADEPAEPTGDEPPLSEEELVVTAEVVAPDAELRCDLLGYACGWDDAPPGAMAASFELLEATREVMIAAGDPRASVEAAAASLRSDDRVVEVLPDLLGYTGIMFRLEGAPPVILDTELAGPIADETDRERVTLDEVTAAVAEPVGFRAPQRFHPVGGPIKKKTAVIVDPYASTDEQCESTSWEGLGQILDWESPVRFRECRQTGEGISEGSAIAAIFRSRPDDYTTVTHLKDSAATPSGIASAVVAADAVHIATHGSSNCGGDLADSLQPVDYEPSLCYSMMALGKLTAEERQAAAAGTLVAPVGASFSGTRWWATGDFIAGTLRRDSIVFASHCTSGDGRLGAAGLAGFVGWHSYARVTSAVDAAMRFWGLMVTDGVEFDLAYDVLRDEGLHVSTFTNAPEYIGRRATARLVAGGTNPRARDVIELQYEGARLADGGSVEIEGTPGDSVKDRVEDISFKVEGVKDGTEGSTTIQLYVDGKKVEPPIKVSEGQILDSGDGWSDWLVKPESIELPFDVQLSDLNPNGRPGYVWEARVFERENRYSADEARPVFFDAQLTATGRLALFDDLGAQLASTGVELTENLLTIDFPSKGGAVNGSFVAIIEGPGAGGAWSVGIDGEFDPASGSMTGSVDGAAFGGGQGIFAGDTAEGPFVASFDWGSGTVSGTMLSGQQAQSFTATLS